MPDLNLPVPGRIALLIALIAFRTGVPALAGTRAYRRLPAGAKLSAAILTSLGMALFFLPLTRWVNFLPDLIPSPWDKLSLAAGDMIGMLLAPGIATELLFILMPKGKGGSVTGALFTLFLCLLFVYPALSALQSGRQLTACLYGFGMLGGLATGLSVFASRTRQEKRKKAPRA